MSHPDMHCDMLNQQVPSAAIVVGRVAFQLWEYAGNKACGLIRVCTNTSERSLLAFKLGS